MSTTFQVSRTRLGWYADLPGTSDVWLAILLQNTGLEADGVLADYGSVSTLLAGASDEATFTNYARKQISVLTPTSDNTNNRNLIDIADLTWALAGGAINNTLGKFLLAYDPAPGTSTDVDRVPLLAFNIFATTDGNDLTVRIHADGLVRVYTPGV